MNVKNIMRYHWHKALVVKPFHVGISLFIVAEGLFLSLIVPPHQNEQFLQVSATHSAFNTQQQQQAWTWKNLQKTILFAHSVILGWWCRSMVTARQPYHYAMAPYMTNEQGQHLIVVFQVLHQCGVSFLNQWPYDLAEVRQVPWLIGVT